LSALITTAARDLALANQEQKPCTVVAIRQHKCSLVYGIGACTATGGTGNECYNTKTTCQVKTAYSDTVVTVNFISRGVTIPVDTGLPVITRPYVLKSSISSPLLDFEAGMSARNLVTISMSDETDNDSDQDPYYLTRATPAQGTFWQRFIARNKFYFSWEVLIRQGFVVSPWDWTTFLDELYLITQIAIENTGQVKLTLKDPLKLADNNKLPMPTNGKCASDLKGVQYTGTLVSADSTHVTFANDSSPIDNLYQAMEIYITGNAGQGQRRVVSSYIGATRTATISSAWSVIPDNTSVVEVSGLSIALANWSTQLYPVPTTERLFVRIGSEIIEYTGSASGKLTWGSSANRAQFGSAKSDHKAGDAAQLCWTVINQPVSAVITKALTATGIQGYISADLVSECDSWYPIDWNMTACISAPESVTSILADLLKDIRAIMWYAPQTQTIEFKSLNPNLNLSPVIWDDNANIIKGGTSMIYMDNLRITQAATSYGLKDATANQTEPKNFGITDLYLSAGEYGDVKPMVKNSRWFTSANAVAVLTTLNRVVNQLYDAPKFFKFNLSKKDYIKPLGAEVGIKHYRNVDFSGKIKQQQCIITQLVDMGTHIELQARSTNLDGRWCFIAADVTADYPTDSAYGHISLDTSLMSDGTEGFKII
jgi:hypothetical protein